MIQRCDSAPGGFVKFNAFTHCFALQNVTKTFADLEYGSLPAVQTLEWHAVRPLSCWTSAQLRSLWWHLGESNMWILKPHKSTMLQLHLSNLQIQSNASSKKRANNSKAAELSSSLVPSSVAISTSWTVPCLAVTVPVPIDRACCIERIQNYVLRLDAIGRLDRGGRESSWVERLLKRSRNSGSPVALSRFFTNTCQFAHSNTHTLRYFVFIDTLSITLLN